MAEPDPIPHPARGLSGIFFLIKRNGRTMNRCFEDLTEAEQREKLAGVDPDWPTNIAIALAQALRRVGDELNIVSDNVGDEDG